MIEAAGGVVWRRGSKGSLKVLLVHRDRYDDWSFPKGKLDAGESHRHAALREVEEETGLRCKTGDELPEVRYDDRKGRAEARALLEHGARRRLLRAERRGRRGALAVASTTPRTRSPTPTTCACSTASVSSSSARSRAASS